MNSNAPRAPRRGVFLLLLILALIVPPLAAQPLPAAQAVDSLGVNIHFTDAKPGELEELGAAGFRWVRMDFVWDSTERSPNVYDFSAYDRLLDQLQRCRLHAIFILDYSNPLYETGRSVPDAPGRAAYGRWASAAVTHFAGAGIVWEIWNEPNGSFWQPRASAAEYTQMALSACKAIAAAEPHETLVGPACAGFDWPFLETCFKSGLLQYWSAVTVHPYRRGSPETVTADYARLQAMIDLYKPPGKQVSIMSGEWGYSVDETAEAGDLARELLTNIADRTALSIWYDWHDDGLDPGNPEHHFGVVRYAYHPGEDPVYDPKPAYRAMRTLTQSLGDSTFMGVLAVGDPVTDHVLYFSGSHGIVYAAWTTSSAPHMVIAPLAAGRYAATGLLGASGQPVFSGPAGADITLTSTPIYYSRPPFGTEFRDKLELFPTP